MKAASFHDGCSADFWESKYNVPRDRRHSTPSKDDFHGKIAHRMNTRQSLSTGDNCASTKRGEQQLGGRLSDDAFDDKANEAPRFANLFRKLHAGSKLDIGLGKFRSLAAGSSSSQNCTLDEKSNSCGKENTRTIVRTILNPTECDTVGKGDDTGKVEKLLVDFAS